MTIAEMAKIIAVLSTGFKNIADGGRAKAAAWHKILGDIDYAIAQQAAMYLLNTCKFDPKPSDFREAVNKIKNCGIPTAEEAWSEVMRNLNPYKKPTWSTSVIANAVKAIGYTNLCNTECIGVERAHFFNIYNNLLARAQEGELIKIVQRLPEHTEAKLIG